MNILVTGANGFLGRHVVGELLSRIAPDSTVRCLVRRSSEVNGLDEGGAKIIRGSLNNDQDLDTMLENVDVIVHLAASKSGSPMGMFAETVVSTEKLVACAPRSGVRKMVFCSSFSVYGTSLLDTGSVVDEECPIEPQPARRDPYAWCKFYQEHWARTLQSDADLVIVRPGVIYGEDQGLLSPRVGLHLPGLPFFLKIGGSAPVPLTHVKNCASLIAMATLNDSIKSGVYNAVDDECPKQSDYIAMYEEKFGKIPYKIPLPYFLFLAASYCYELLHRMSGGNFPAIFSPYKTRTMYRAFEFSNNKAKSDLDWKPEVSLAAGLSDSQEYVRRKENDDNV